MTGYILNPKVSVYVDDELVNELSVETTIDINEKFVYSTKDNDCKISKLLPNGTIVNLVDSLTLSNNNSNFFKLPIGYSTIRLSAENEILNSKLTIYKEYIAV